jgi:hypothetical protein
MGAQSSPGRHGGSQDKQRGRRLFLVAEGLQVWKVCSFIDGPKKLDSGEISGTIDSPPVSAKTNPSNLETSHTYLTAAIPS